MSATTMPYGAAELKTSYNRNLGTALFLSILLHLLFFGVYKVISSVGSVRQASTDRVSGGIILLPPIPKQKDPSGKSQTDREAGATGGRENGKIQVTQPGTDHIAGMPNAVEIDTLADRFAPMGDIGSALPTLGSGGPITLDTGRGPSISSANTLPSTDATSLPSPDDFVAVEEEPRFDRGDLMRRVKYPEIARRNGIQGMVVVRVLVGRDGRPLNAIINRSDNRALEDAAREAVMGTAFTPAIQNGAPVAVWVQVPVTFTLH